MPAAAADADAGPVSPSSLSSPFQEAKEGEEVTKDVTREVTKGEAPLSPASPPTPAAVVAAPAAAASSSAAAGRVRGSGVGEG